MTRGDGAPEDSPKVAGVILAGGRARRMGGGDKGLQALAGQPLIAHVIARGGPQVAALAINANGDPARFADFALPVVQDSVSGFAGPLAGVLAGLDWAAEAAPDCDWLATFACDAPFFPEDLVGRLSAEVRAAGADLACARGLAPRRQPGPQEVPPGSTRLGASPGLTRRPSRRAGSTLSDRSPARSS